MPVLVLVVPVVVVVLVVLVVVLVLVLVVLLAVLVLVLVLDWGGKMDLTLILPCTAPSCDGLELLCLNDLGSNARQIQPYRSDLD